MFQSIIKLHIIAASEVIEKRAGSMDSKSCISMNFKAYGIKSQNTHYVQRFVGYLTEMSWIHLLLRNTWLVKDLMV